MYDVIALWTLGQRVENIVHPSTQRCQLVLKQTAIMLLARTNDSVASPASPCDTACPVAETVRRAGNADITFRQLLQGDKLEAYADGSTVNVRATDGYEQTVGVTSLRRKIQTTKHNVFIDTCSMPGLVPILRYLT